LAAAAQLSGLGRWFLATMMMTMTTLMMILTPFRRGCHAHPTPLFVFPLTVTRALPATTAPLFLNLGWSCFFLQPRRERVCVFLSPPPFPVATLPSTRGVSACAACARARRQRRRERDAARALSRQARAASAPHLPPSPRSHCGAANHWWWRPFSARPNVVRARTRAGARTHFAPKHTHSKFCVCVRACDFFAPHACPPPPPLTQNDITPSHYAKHTASSQQQQHSPPAAAAAAAERKGKAGPPI
jgi:hypothetical protein